MAEYEIVRHLARRYGNLAFIGDIDQYDFFRRREIKDAAAWLQLILNPYDSEALERVLLRPGRGIGPAAIRQVQTEGEVIQLAAVKLEKGKLTDSLTRHIKNSRPVGESEQVYGLSDDFLAKNGEPAGAVFKAFFCFVAEALLVGHSVGFDVKKVQAHARREGLTPPPFIWDDTKE